MIGDDGKYFHLTISTERRTFKLDHGEPDLFFLLTKAMRFEDELTCPRRFQ